MKQISLFILFTIFLGFNLKAQNEKIESARIAFITTKVDLSPQQAEKFWPIYNEYSKEQRALREEYLKSRRKYSQGQLTEEESEELVELGLNIKKRSLELEKIYSEKFTKVISNRQLVQLNKAEEDFKKLLLQRLKERRQGRSGTNFRDN